MQLLTASAILDAKDFQEAVLEVPEWGGQVKVRTLSMGARYTINERAVVVKGSERAVNAAVFAAATLEHGLIEPKLGREQAEKVVAEHSFQVIDRICSEIWKMSGMTPETAKNA